MIVDILDPQHSQSRRQRSSRRSAVSTSALTATISRVSVSSAANTVVVSKSLAPAWIK